MAVKSYLDLSGLSHFHDMAIANKISNVAFYESCGSAEVADATYTAENSPYYSKSGDTYTRVAVTKGDSVASYYHAKAANVNETKVAPSIKATVDHVDAEVEEAVTALETLIGQRISSVNYGDATISGSAFHGIYTVNGGTKAVAAVDSTAGGTHESTALITSGAVNSGLASINAAKINKSIFTTAGDIIYASAADTPVRLGIGSSGQILTVVDGAPAWVNAPETGVTDVKLNNTSVVTSGVANLVADTTAGGTYQSTDLITSGAVNAGLAAIAEGVSAKVDDVKVDGTSVVTNKVANIDLTGKADKSATVSSVDYDTTNSKITKTINGTTTDVVAIDTTAGGTASSTSLITSGAVNEGLGSLDASLSAVSTRVTTLEGKTNLSDFTDDLGSSPTHTHSQYALANAPTIESPTLTGTPTAPTAAAGTSTTQIATTAFVMAAIQTAIQNAMSASY